MPHAAYKIRPIAQVRTSRIGVIDIGSNSIRLVVYDRLSRSPAIVFNEKVLCGLGRDLGRTGRLHPDGVALALSNLSRFRLLLEGMHVDRVDVLATAAVREAADGAAFVDQVGQRCGLQVRVISGVEEARLSALGVLSGAPGADGVMGDLGGGSLELVGLDRGRLSEQVTLPLGPFRLMDGSRSKARDLIAQHLADQAWLSRFAGRTFYPVGGNWRALAKVHIEQRRHPVHIVHQYCVPTDDIASLAGLIGKQGKNSLERMLGVSKRRLETLPLAALAMEGVLTALRPKNVVFSALGLREGHLYDLLTEDERAADPLIAACRDLASRLDRFGKVDRLQEWSAGLFPDEPPAHTRLREAACLLSDICWREHPDYRAEHAFLRTLRLPVAGLEHTERAFLAGTLYARYGGVFGDRLTAAPSELLSTEEVNRANLIGAVLRLGHSVSGGAVSVLEDTRLELTPETVLLWLSEEEECLGGDVVQRRLDAVARALNRVGRIVVAQREELLVGE